MSNRKGPKRVKSIDGKEFVDDVVDDSDYEEAVKVQDMELLAAGESRKVLGRIRLRLERGARDGGRRYYFDPIRGIVRRRQSAKEA